MKKLVALFVAVLLTSLSIVNAQEKPVRIGLKFGVPNLAGFNVEYVTPLVGGRVAPTLDFSYFSIGIGDFKVGMSYFELGGNFYFAQEKARGGYAHLSYGRIGISGDFTQSVEFTGVTESVTGEASLGINLLNIKLGAKLGKGFYFRPEIGYGLLLGDVKAEAEFSSTITGEVKTEEVDIPDIISGGPIINIGFGVAF